jgi:hypothetical protein
MTVSAVTLIPVRDGLWRVIGGSGSVAGHIERFTDVDGDRFLARRIVSGQRILELGSFCRSSDAADCFR